MRTNKTKKICNITLGMIGLLIAIYALIPKGISYKNVGIAAIFAFGILSAVNFLLLPCFSNKKIIKRLRIILNIFLSTVVCIFIAGSVIIYATPNKVPDEGEYTLVVLGAKVIGDEPGGVLKNRLDTAADFLKEHPDVKCIVTGGQGKDEAYPEAVVMKKYLVKIGIEEDRIVVEDKSTSTKENIDNALILAEQNGISVNFVICTDPFHQYRAKLFCDENNIVSYSLNAPVNLWIEPIYLTREILAVFYYFIL